MKSCVSTMGLGIAVFVFFGFQPAEAGCQLIHATHSAPSQAKAVESSRALALQSAYDLQRASGWNHITLTAHPVQGDPFWKAVRPKGVPAHARLQPDLVTAQFYTTCFTGVAWASEHDGVHNASTAHEANLPCDRRRRSGAKLGSPRGNAGGRAQRARTSRARSCGDRSERRAMR